MFANTIPRNNHGKLLLHGLKFNKLTVIEEDSYDRIKGTFWICQCECGNFSKVKTQNIPRTLSCGCSKKQLNSIRKYVGDISGTIWSSIKNSAIKRKIEFKITQEYVDYIYKQQDKKCKLSNIELVFGNLRQTRYLTTASLDRIDNNLGYIEGNVQWIHKHINNMKLKFNLEYFLSLCESIYNFKNKFYEPVIKPLSGHISNMFWSSITISAKKRNLDFLITKEYAYKLFEKQKGICNLSGKNIILCQSPEYKNRNLKNASLDRIDSKKGYVNGNLQWIHKDINWMKWHFEENLFLEYCKLITINNRNNNEKNNPSSFSS